MRIAPILAALTIAFVAPAPAQNLRERTVAAARLPIEPIDAFAVEQVAGELKSPWSIAFLPDGGLLLTEKHGGLRMLSPDGVRMRPLAGGPANVLAESDSGLLDIALDPDFATNHRVFVAFAEGTKEANRTALWRARLDGSVLRDGQVIFRVVEPKADTAHPGGRLLFLPDKTVLLTVGDGFDYRDKAQDPGSHLGKVLRLDRDGKAPADNPFVGRAGWLPEIWTLGHRNIQGLARDPATGDVWANEHGPRGGDELNKLVAGSNYGWPRASFGIDYDGTLITANQHVDGMVDPLFVWAPSIAPSGLAIYRGDKYPNLDGRFLVGSLAFRMLVQVRAHPRTGLLLEESRQLLGLKKRIRDVRVSPSEEIYLLTDEEAGSLLRLVPLAADTAR